MAKASITKRTVDAAKPAARDIFIWDTEVAGFGLKVTPAGAKVYVFQYRISRPGEASRTPAKRYTIGKHGRLTPEQARKRAKALATLVEDGIDPRQRDLDEIATRDEAALRMQERERLEGELAFENLAAHWLEHYENDLDRRPSSLRQAKLVVNNHLKPQLAGKPMPHIDRSDLQSVIDAIPSKQRGMRRAAFAYASVLFGWAAKRGYIPINPLTGMTKPEAPRARDRVLTDDELKKIWSATYKLSKPFGSFFRLLILTGQRRSEVAASNWAELNQATATWIIPAERAKNGIQHIVPLNQAIIAELDELARTAQASSKRPTRRKNKEWPRSGFVLSTTGHSPISGITKVKNALDKEIAGAREDQFLPHWRIHDLRRTIATGCQRLGVRFEVTESILNHVGGAKGGVAGIYQKHDWKDEKRAALEAWAAHLSSLVSQANLRGK